MLFAITLLAATPGVGCPPVSPSLSWKTDLTVPQDPFEGSGVTPGLPGWVKFTIRTCEPRVVLYQDAQVHPFHHDFATSELPPFVGMSSTEYEAVTLFNAGREALLGAVLTPPTTNENGFPIPSPSEYGVQLVSSDPLDPQFVVDAITSVRLGVSAPPSAQVFYFPTFEQRASALANEAFFEANGILVGSVDRWSDDDSIYSPGWAIGRLVQLPASEVEDAFEAGILQPDDILLTEDVPSDVPLVAGMLTLAPSTPSSHAAILAQTFGVPFVYMKDQAVADRALELVGHNVLVRAYPASDTFGNAKGVGIFDLDGQLDAAQRAELAALKLPEPLNLQPTTSFGGYSADVDGLQPSDIQHFGGKAAGYAILRTAIPANCPLAAALSFDLFDEYLDQTMRTGNTLRQEIDSLLSQHSYPPANMQAFFDDLSTIRDWIRDDEVTSFTPGQEAAILAMLNDPQYGFNLNAKIRFRSSTNVEDSERFTGAGLYDSSSGCLQDDLDGDDVGPSQCEPSQSNERGVFRAIRKVFSSFYFDNAALERKRHGIVEADVGMAILVHHNFPDELELANGVITFTRRGFQNQMQIVTQDGAVSVSNPDGEGLPEVVTIDVGGFGGDVLSFVQGSTLVQLGDTVMDWESDYWGLRDLVLPIAAEFEQRSGKSEYVLDMEFKKMTPGGAAVPAGGLVIKQVREIPLPDATPSVTPFLLNVPFDWVTLQGEGGSTFSNNRLKVRMRLETRNTFLTPRALQESLYTNVELTYADGCRVHSLEGALSGLPGYDHLYTPEFGGRTEDSWDFAGDAHARRWTLITYDVPTLFPPARCPVVVQEDMGFGDRFLRSSFTTPVLTSLAFGTVYDTTDYAVLDEAFVPAGPPEFGAPDPSQGPPTFDLGDVEIWSRFEMQNLNPCVEICAGATSVLHHFEGTVITGLTSTPLVLESEFSQTFRAGHHNFVDYFLFVPSLDPNVTTDQRLQLEAQDVYAIYVEGSAFQLGGPVQRFEILSAAEVGPFCDEVPLDRSDRLNAIPPGAGPR